MSYARTMGAEVEAATATPYEMQSIGPHGDVGPIRPYDPHFMRRIGGGALRPAPFTPLGTIGDIMSSPLTTAVGLGLMIAGALYVYKGVKL